MLGNTETPRCNFIFAYSILFTNKKENMKNYRRKYRKFEEHNSEQCICIF